MTEIPERVLREWREHANAALHEVSLASAAAENMQRHLSSAQREISTALAYLDRALAQPPPEREEEPPPGEVPLASVALTTAGRQVREYIEAGLASNGDSESVLTAQGWHFERGRFADVHAFTRRVAPNAYLVDVLISNASVNPDGTGARGHVALDSLSIGFADGWESYCERETEWGAFPLPSRMGFVRRFAVWRAGDEEAQDEARRALFLGHPDPSRWYSGDFGPNRDAVPNWDALAKLANSDFWSWESVEARARDDYTRLLKGAERPEGFKATGPFDPIGYRHGATAGGSGIVTASWNLGRYGLLAQRVRMDRIIERSPCFAWNAETGEPLTAADIAEAHGGVFPHEMAMTVDSDTRGLGLPYWNGLPWIGTPTDEHKRQLDRLTDLNDTIGKVNAPDYHDDQHLGRAYHNAADLAYAVGDPAARLWLGALWAHAEHHWHVENTGAVGGVRPSYRWGLPGRFAGSLKKNDKYDPGTWGSILEEIREHGAPQPTRHGTDIHPPGRGDWNSREHAHVGLLAVIVRDLGIRDDLGEWFAWADTYMAYVCPDSGCMERRPDPVDRPDGPARTQIKDGKEIPADTFMSPAPERNGMPAGHSAGHLFEGCLVHRFADAAEKCGNWLPKSEPKLGKAFAATVVEIHNGKPPFAGFIGFNERGEPYPAHGWGKGTEGSQLHSMLFRSGWHGALAEMVRQPNEKGALNATDYVRRTLDYLRKNSWAMPLLDHVAPALAAWPGQGGER